MSSSKGYESRAVQTTFSPPCSPCSVVPPQPSPLDCGPHSGISTSTTESSLETPDNPSQNSDGSLVSYLSTPDRSIFDNRRVFKTRLPQNFPSRATQIIGQRISSLPETAPSFSVMSQISSQQRVVTMPENIRSQRLEKEFIHYLPEYGGTPADSSNSFSISDGNSSFARADATGTDISHSSSSPSSPDSVVIIQNKYHISQAFLRQTNVQTKAKPDEGMVEEWMTWASSPPRPIPALHGPSSLPYARCPSGAEGTIIEEQDNLPRMIWGLDQDTAKPDVAPPETSHRTSETTPATGVTWNAPNVVASQGPPVNTESTTIAARQKNHNSTFVEPIDLGPMLAPHTQGHIHQPPQIDVVGATGVADIPFQQKAHHERHFNKRQELGVGLKPLPRRHETSKNVKPLVSTQTVVGSSLPIIILESHPQSISIPTKRRQSAMEIAQQYRKNQGLFQPAAQPQWPSSPSYSRALQAIHLHTLSDETPEPPLPSQTRVYNHSAGDVYLAPSDVVDSQAISAYGLYHPAGLSRARKVLTSPGSDLGSYPRPPPNTPMNVLGKPRMANAPLQMNHLPASPDSPSTAIRSLRHAKAAPLTRNSHRRLSAVLEASEDQTVGVGFRPLSPPPFQQNFHLSRPLIPDGTAHSSSYTNLAKNRQDCYYQLENVSKANPALLSEDFANLTVESFTPGWIQPQAQPGGSFMNRRQEVPKVDPQPAQRAHKVNKPASSGKARGPGPKTQPQAQAPGRKSRSKKKILNGMTVIAA